MRLQHHSGWPKFSDVFPMSTINKPVICSEDNCETVIADYRQCAYRKCSLDMGYCKAHGGDARAVDEMVAHHATHKETT